MTVLVQNQTTKKFGPFSALFYKSAESSALDFPGLTQFFSAPFVFCGRNFGPLATLFSIFMLKIVSQLIVRYIFCLKINLSKIGTGTETHAMTGTNGY
jgi:hypothetical protein